MSGKRNPLAIALMTADDLANWEGEYQYPAGLLRRGADVITELVREIQRLNILLLRPDETFED